MNAIFNYIVNTIVILVLLIVGQAAFVSAKAAYYTHMPIDTFYKNLSFTAGDACVGDKYHLIHSVRQVNGTDIGYSGEVVREMFLYKDGKPVKLFEETASPFIEVRPDGMVTRLQSLPHGLGEGHYQWVIYLTLFIHGVPRTDVPPLESNLFTIRNCS